jgi:hypothetical protein
MDSANVSAIISAASGLTGVGVGAFLSYLRDRRVEKIKDARDSSYLAILVVSHLDRFANGCMHVSFDDGTSEGRPAGEDGYHRTTVSPPKFAPLEIEVEWKVLPRDVMYEILQIPDKQERIENEIAGASEFDEPPDYCEYFWARRRAYAELGLHVSTVANRLRNFAGMPIEERHSGDWDRDVAMREVIEKVDSDRSAYEKRQAETWAKMEPIDVPPAQSG